MIAPQPEVQALAGNIYNWLGKVGFPVAPYTTSYGVPQNATPDSVAWATPGQIYINPSLSGTMGALAARYGTRRGINDRQADALRNLIHESLHQMRYGRTPGFYQGQAVGTPGGYEEGATESVAQDLFGIYAKKFFGQPIAPERARPSAYTDQVNDLRQLSTFGSNSKKFTDRGARVWRRTFLHADEPTREQMVVSARAIRDRWGQANGR